MNLDLSPKGIEFIYDELDSNAINFRLDTGYFSIQTCVYLEEEQELNEPHFELNDQGNSQYGGLDRIVFSANKISLKFLKNRVFLEKYESITIRLACPVDKKTVDFFANHLFLGRHIEYERGFPTSNMVPQTQQRE